MCRAPAGVPSFQVFHLMFLCSPKRHPPCYFPSLRPGEVHKQLQFSACAALRTLSVSFSTYKALPSQHHQPENTKILPASPAPTSCQVVSWDLYFCSDTGGQWQESVGTLVGSKVC